MACKCLSVHMRFLIAVGGRDRYEMSREDARPPPAAALA
jgi:hypothetical protein